MAQLSEEQIRQIAEEAIQQLGKSATPEVVEEIVRETVRRMDGEQPAVRTEAAPVNTNPAKKSNRIIVTAFGRNQVGILAGLTGLIAECNCDILDLSQKILQDFFTIMLLVDISESTLSFDEIKKRLIQKGEQLDLKVIVQHEDIFNAMHRI